MEVSKIKSSVIKKGNLPVKGKLNNNNFTNNLSVPSCNAVSFKGINIVKKSLMYLRNLSEYMKEPSEMTNAIIQMIGTGLIAPFAIMYSPSPKKKGEKVINEKEAKEKKFFQAIRQPISAFLAFDDVEPNLSNSQSKILFPSISCIPHKPSFLTGIIFILSFLGIVISIIIKRNNYY